MKKFLYFILGLVVLVGVVYGALMVVLGSGKNVEVRVSEKDYASALQKSNVKISDINALNLTSLGQKSFVAKGKVNVNTSYTSEEMSALVSKANENNGPIKDVNVKFLENGNAEASFKISESAINFIKTNETLKGIKIPGLVNNVINPQFAALTDFLANYISKLAENKTVYAKGSLVKTSSNSVTVRIDSLTIGQISMSEDVKRKVEKGTQDFVNSLITGNNGFYIEELRVENGKLIYKGTLPAEVAGK